MSIAHGTILGGTAVVPDLEPALAGYRDTLGLELVEHGPLASDLAAAFGASASAGAPHAVLKVRSAEPCCVRLVEQPDHPDFRPTRTYGWSAFEFSVEDVWRWPGALPPDQFTVVGPPKTLQNIEPAFIPMQALGTGREMIYLNQVLKNMPDTDLPKATAAVDRIFIVVLAAPDRLAALDWYQRALALDRGSDYRLLYSMINSAFDLPADTLSTITMIRAGRMPIVEVDDYPSAATPRPAHDDMLPPGNALVTLAVDNLSACACDWIAPPVRRTGVFYRDRRAATTIGPAGELLELVEVGA